MMTDALWLKFSSRENWGVLVGLLGFLGTFSFCFSNFLILTIDVLDTSSVFGPVHNFWEVKLEKYYL